MVEQEHNPELDNKLDAKYKELNEIKDQLRAVDKEKEAWFHKKKTISQKIYALLNEVREERTQRNSFTKQVKSSKERRGQLNDEIKQKIDQMKALQKEKNAVTKKLGIQIDPGRVRDEIDQLEFRIETEAIPFSVEQKIMKMISEKRKLLEQYKEVSGVFDKIRNLDKEIKKLKQKADEAHRKIQTKAGESQEHHEALIESSKSIDDLRKQEEEALKNFVEWKTKHNELYEKMNAKLGEIREIKGGIEGVESQKREKAHQEAKQKLKEKEMTVEEKIKKGQKLTTEDLMIFQAQDAGFGNLTIKKRSNRNSNRR